MKLIETAQALTTDFKGILAADESNGTIKKRFDAIKVESTEDNRRDYRELMFQAKGVEKYISGVIMYDETFNQKAADGTYLRDLLKSKNIIPGIKVDTGAKELAGSPNECVTEGLDGLRERLQQYAKDGAGFAKWRAVIKIHDNAPTDYCIKANAHALARYAKLCQESGIVPIVEPEVLMDGTHDIKDCYLVTARALHILYKELYEQGVVLQGTLLKPNMVVAGKDCENQASTKDVAEYTVQCLLENVPAAVAGVVFLSGGQSAQKATEHLNEMNKLFPNLPWPLSYSYGRALQEPVQKAWLGDAANSAKAQAALMTRAKCNSAAAEGSYSPSMETT